MRGNGELTLDAEGALRNSDSATEPWPGGKKVAASGCYEYKNVRFRLQRFGSSDQWSFQPFGREAQEFGTWEDAVAALEAACTAIALKRAERRNR